MVRPTYTEAHVTMLDPFFDEDDLLHDSNYCRHGQFIGNPYGADYMCGWCESGEEPPTQAEEDAWTLAEAERKYDHLVIALERIDVNQTHRWALVRTAIDSISNWGQNTSVQRAWERTHA